MPTLVVMQYKQLVQRAEACRCDDLRQQQQLLEEACAKERDKRRRLEEEPQTQQRDFA